MAFTATVSKGGVTLPNMYIRLVSMVGSKRDGWDGCFRVFSDQNQPLWVDEFRVRCAYVAGEDPYTTLYNDCKTIFVDAVDVLEETP